mmetsp:Transcript_59030/g.67225  ORF Transcript_59030/g.67225 Transcript_59030/m.67225 type:complete len:218 (-) Transcript_59030:16-669(-)
MKLKDVFKSGPKGSNACIYAIVFSLLILSTSAHKVMARSQIHQATKTHERTITKSQERAQNISNFIAEEKWQEIMNPLNELPPAWGRLFEHSMNMALSGDTDQIYSQSPEKSLNNWQDFHRETVMRLNEVGEPNQDEIKTLPPDLYVEIREVISNRLVQTLEAKGGVDQEDVDVIMQEVTVLLQKAQSSSSSEDENTNSGERNIGSCHILCSLLVCL